MRGRWAGWLLLALIAGCALTLPEVAINDAGHATIRMPPHHPTETPRAREARLRHIEALRAEGLIKPRKPWWGDRFWVRLIWRF